ncbi:Geranylgeranyl transferase type-2 subunit alpha 1 [Camellia lanceoleosa]|nr:Geranylgeranyl transferase type-2 subunit alpha 1 [Camellia lanceoleosa]
MCKLFSYTKEALDVNAKLLEANPEYLTVWNYRKFDVEYILSHLETDTEIDPDSIKSIYSEELRVELQLLGVFLKKDSRNFHAWNYQRFIAALKNRSDEEELHFITDLINKNFSNYSSWHNRRAQGSFSKEKVLTEEYDLVHQALFTNPDDQSGCGESSVGSTWPPHGSNLNVSAYGFLDTCASSPITGFHLNSGIVQSFFILMKQESPFLQTHPVKVSLGHSQGIVSLSGFHHCLSTHFEFAVLIQPHGSQHAEMKSAEMISWGDENFHTGETHLQEPTQVKNFDQLRNSEVNESRASKWSAETIVNEIALFRELLSEINWYIGQFYCLSNVPLFSSAGYCNKIGKLMLARLLTTHDAMMSYDKTPETCKMVHSEEVKVLYSDLMTLDPPHSQYYKDEYKLVVLKAFIAITGLLRSSGTNNYICLRLNNLSLSHIRSIEKLLWAQMLDLSHNQLSSIEGLQAMQLLSCLNLSNNKMGSFSALEPLKLLKSLKVLDISYNEIGAHAVDTRRYLCSSPLSHIVGSDWNFGEFVISGVNVTNYWEVFAIFKDSKLTQLDIIGNVVAEEEFKLFLVKTLRALNWLDGVESIDSTFLILFLILLSCRLFSYNLPKNSCCFIR